MEVDIPQPNEALAAVLISPEMYAAVDACGHRAHAFYQTIVAKRTGRLAGSGIVQTEIGGVRHDRYVSHLTVGAGLDYGAAHEFGVGDHPQSVHNLDGPNHIMAAAHDMNRVLEALGE